MSIALMNEVWKRPARDSSERLVLLALADISNDEGVLWPSVATVGERSCLSTDQARRHMRRLIRDGVLHVIGNHDGGATSRRYRLDVRALTAERVAVTPCAHATPCMDATPCADASPCIGARAGTDARDPLHARKATPCTHASRTINEPSGSTTARANFSADFECAMAAYPRRAGGNPKRPAWRAWKARLTAGVSAREMLDGVARYAAFIRGTGKEGTQFVKQAATFFGPDEHFREGWNATGDSMPGARASAVRLVGNVL